MDDFDLYQIQLCRNCYCKSQWCFPCEFLFFTEVRETEDVRSSTTDKPFRFIGNSFEITLKIIITYFNPFHMLI